MRAPPPSGHFEDAGIDRPPVWRGWCEPTLPSGLRASRRCGALWMAVVVALAQPEALRAHAIGQGGRGNESVPQRQLPIFIRDLEDQWLTKTPYSGM
jgi:hypothetical protein